VRASGRSSEGQAGAAVFRATTDQVCGEARARDAKIDVTHVMPLNEEHRSSILFGHSIFYSFLFDKTPREAINVCSNQLKDRLKKTTRSVQCGGLFD
jgi:hypothetical protein